jgi:hypothetical protein
VGDVIYLAAVVVFFAVVVLVVRACELIVGSGPSINRDAGS